MAVDQWWHALSCRHLGRAHDLLRGDQPRPGRSYLKGTDLTPVPSNAFSLGKPTLNKKAGTAATPVTVPGAGTLTLGGKGVAARNQVASRSGTVQLR